MFSLPQLDPDPIFGVMAQWRHDQNTHKVNLGIGIYRNAQGAPFVFPSVQESAKQVPTHNFEYELMNGNQAFLSHTGRLFLGAKFKTSEWALQQSCGGTHAMRLFGDLCHEALDRYQILVGTPTWPNHYGLFQGAEWIEFPHLTPEHEINMEGYQKAISDNPGTTILLQGGPTHNPIGINFTLKQWQEIALWAKASKVKILVDFAYLGFGDGIEADRKCLEILYKTDCDFAFGVSYSKNAALYSERLGGLFIRVQDRQEKAKIESQTYRLIRQSISGLPQHGARIMNHIFEERKETWLSELEAARQDINARRERFISMLPPSFDYLSYSRGMFGMMYLKPQTVEKLKKEHAIYLTQDSRVNFAGIRDQDYEYLSEVFTKVLNQRT